MAEAHTPSYKSGDTLEGDKYRLERLLGAGSYAEVWLATDTADGSSVAIKIRHWQLTAETIKRRFLGEMQIARRLGKCEHIVTALVYLNREGKDGYSGIVQEFIDGGSLRDRLNEGTPSEQEALRIISHILKALIVAHGAGVIHRDLKPENVLMNALTSPATAMITDFGVAHASGGQRMTQIGYSMGTPQYTAPEQAAGATLATHRSDLFSVGVMLAELVGVDPIVQSADMSGVGQMNNPTVLRAWWDRITNPGIRGIVEQATAVEYDYLGGTVTARRFASAEIMLSAVEAAMEGASRDEPAWTPHPSQEPETVREGGTAVPSGDSESAPWQTYVASQLDDDDDPPPNVVVSPPRKWGWWIGGGVAVGAVILVVIFFAWPKGGTEVGAPPVAETHVDAPVTPPSDPIPTPVEIAQPTVGTPPVTPAPIVDPKPKVPVKVEAPKPPTDPKPKAQVETPVTNPPPVATPTVTEPKITIVSPQAEAKVGETIAIKAKVMLPPGSTVSRASLYWQGANGGAWQSKSVTVNAGTIETSIPASAGLGASVQYYVAIWLGDVRKNGDKVTTSVVP